MLWEVPGAGHAAALAAEYAWRAIGFVDDALLR